MAPTRRRHEVPPNTLYTQVSPTDCAEVTVVLSDVTACRRRLVGLLLLLFIVTLVISDLHCYVKGVRVSP